MRSYLIVAGLLLLATLIMLPPGWARRLERVERRILRLFLVLRLFLPLVYLYLADRSEEFFDGGSDVIGYVDRAKAVSTQLNLQGFSQAHANVPGTGSIDLILGHLFRYGGPNRIAAAYFLSGLATLAMLAIWIATRTLIHNRRGLYAGLLLLAPTTLFWSASIGKEALILLGIGCAVSVFMTVIDRRRRLTPRTVAHAALGVVLLGYIRPHIALLLLAAMIIAAFLSSNRVAVAASGQRKMLLAVIAFGGLLVTFPLSNELLGVSDGESFIDSARQQTERTAGGQGRSGYEAEPVQGIQDVPRALALVLLRPFPWEVRTGFQALAALETAVYMGVLFRGVALARQARRTVTRSPVFVFGATYIALFSSAVVSYGNLGLLVRQRMQVWPLVVLIALLLYDQAERRVKRRPVEGRTKATVSAR